MKDEVIYENRLDLNAVEHLVASIKKEIQRFIIGNDKNIDLLLVGLLSKGHVLVEGVPGVAKTLSAKLIAKAINTDFSRIQFTPDLMPSDVLGTTVFNMSKSEFEFNKGPIFSNIVLIDEINRAPAKTQSALFEVMEEYQVSVDGNTYGMDAPFWVLATQNPIEHEGTYRLPEAQLDRFMLKIEFGYPNEDEELQILNLKQEQKGKAEVLDVQSIVDAAQINLAQELIQSVIVEDNIRKYIVQIIHSTRKNPGIILGASPRATIAVMTASKAMAAIKGRDFVTPDDVKEVVISVLHHRIIITPEKEMEGVSAKQIISNILNKIEVPR